MTTNAATFETAHRPGKALHVSLWAVQVVLAALFGMAGVLKLTTPLAVLATRMPWTAEVPGALVRFIGASELAGALGMLLPALMRIRPALTAWAGVGLATVMVLATGFHVLRGEVPVAVVPAALGALAAFVAWGRFRKAPITPRG